MTGATPESTSSGIALANATFGGAVFVRRVPGTVGRVVDTLNYWFNAGATHGIRNLTIARLFFLGDWSEEAAQRQSEMQVPGDGMIDEVAGMRNTLLAVMCTCRGCLFGFILFRIFSIVNSAPVSQLQNVRGGWGFMLDDVAAGIYAVIVFQLGILIL